MIAILKREFRSFFRTVIGWLFVAVTLAVYGIYFFNYNLRGGSPYIASPLSAVTIILLIAVPILTMRCFSEERHRKTDQLMLTSPVSVGKIVLGKYLAVVSVFTVSIAIFAVTPWLLAPYGTVPMGESYVALLGLWLLGCAYLSIGIFVSSLTESQVISAVLTFVFLFLSFLMSGISSMISADGNWVTRVLGVLDVYTPFEKFMNGNLDLTAVIYYLSVIFLMCFFTVQSIQKRRWSVSRKRLSTGVFSVSSIAVAIALTIGANLLVTKLPADLTAFDCTYNKMYEITDATVKSIQRLDKDVTIYVLNSKKSKDETIDGTLKKYKKLSKHITVKYVNPSVSPDFYKSYTDTAPATNSLIVESSQRSKVIDYYDIFDYQTDYTTYSYTLSGYDAEGQLTSAIEYVTMDDASLPVVYQLSGHGETKLGSAFTSVLEKSNIMLQTLELIKEEAVPEDARALIINAPATDYNEQDAQKIMDYVDAGGKLILTGNCEHQDLKNYNSILKAYGVKFVDGIVAENNTDYYYYAYGPYYLFPKVESTGYTSSVMDSYVFLPLCEGIKVPEDTDELTYTALLQTSEDSVSKTDTQNATTYEFEEGDKKGPFTVALAISKVVSEDKTADIVVIGSPMFFDDQVDAAISGNNASMFTDIVSQLVDEGDVSTTVIPVKECNLSNLTVSATTVIILGLLCAIVAPIILLVLGIVIWTVRRRK